MTELKEQSEVITDFAEVVFIFTVFTVTCRTVDVCETST